MLNTSHNNGEKIKINRYINDKKKDQYRLDTDVY